MASEWQTKTVRQLVNEGVLERPMDGNHGEIHPKTSDFVSDGIPFIMASNLINGCVDTTNCAFIAEKHARTLRKGFAKTGDVLISHKATMGRTAIIERLETPFVMLTPQVTYYRVKDSSRLLNKYLKFYFDNPSFQRLFETWGQKGSTRAYLGITSQLDLPIILPPIEEQRAIAHILGTLDDKIELNRRMNETLEAMARALFKAWFVDFEPVRAKLEGRWQPGQSLPGLPAHLYDLFPDRLVDSELGEIPEGWTVEPLAEAIDFKEGPGIRNWQYTNSDDGVRFINIRCIHHGDLHLDTANRITGEEANGKYAHFHLQPWDIVVSTSGTLGRSAIVRAEHLPLVLNTSVIRFRPIDGKTSFSYLHQYLNGSEFLGDIDTMASGSVQRNFGPVHLKQMEMTLPPFAVMQAFEDICRPISRQIVDHRSLSSSLAALRDALLSKLISGEIRIANAECITEATK